MSTGVAHNDGFDLPFYVDGDAGGPSLVFAHGLMGTAANDRQMIGPFVDAGWQVVTFCQRGHGEATPVTSAEQYDPVAMGHDLWAVADAAGLDRCWIGGGSMGAATSWRAAVLQPERVEGMLQVVPAIRDTPHPMVAMFDIAADTVRDGGVDGLIKLLTDMAVGMGQEQDQGFLDAVRSHDAGSLELALRNVPRWITDDVPSAIKDLPYPIVVLGWEGDAIHPVETARDIAQVSGAKYLEYAQSFADDRPRLARELLGALAAPRGDGGSPPR